jgi:formylglycine-generating enzyme required for sulfatase activity
MGRCNCRGWGNVIDVGEPTEAQWEYATRAGTGTVWWTGSDSASLEGGANLAGPSEAKIAADEWEPNEGWPDDGHLYHAPVGTFAANPFGLHEVSGNVWEWCRDWAGSYDLPVEHGDGERKIDSSRARDRLMRGGSFYGGPRYARSARRSETAGSIAVDNLGVRPACKIIAE